MGTSDLVLFMIGWYVVNATPGLLQGLGFVFGFLFATWAFDGHLSGD
ncbi:MAG: hypothetical protein ACREQW_04860 [Candidatus Binatia bacterium]